MTGRRLLLIGSALFLTALFVVLAVVGDAGVAAGVLAALLAGATLYFQLTGQRPLAPRPKLSLTVDVVGGPGAAPHGDFVALDTEAIVRHEATTAIEHFPALRRDVGQTTGIFDIPRPHTMAEMMQPTRNDLAKFRGEVADYEHELRCWLDEYSDRTWPLVSSLRVKFVVSNSSEVPAENLRVVLRFPPGATSALNQVARPAPPKRPKWRSALDVVLPSAGDVPRLRSPQYDPLDDGGNGQQLTLSVSASLLHGHSSIGSEVADIVLPQPGRYPVHWTAWAANLPRPVSGEATITLKAPVAVRKASSLSELPFVGN